MTDLVIPLGKGSRHNNLELKYCLRSVEKCLKNYRNVYIIGEKPDWITNVIHIPFKDSSHKEMNIMLKTLHACDLPELSDEFIFMNDDHFLLKTIEAESYPYYFNGNLVDWQSKKKSWDPYKQSIQNTISALIKNELPARHYDIHTPILYDKELFKNVMARYDWEIQSGYVIKSLYCNTLNLAGTPLVECKITESLHIYAISDLIINRPVFSLGDGGINDFMLGLLDQSFSKKSKYEL